MTYSTRELNQLKRIVHLTQQLITNAEANNRINVKKSTKASSIKTSKTKSNKRIRRSGAELSAFRKKLLAERNKGIPVAELAKKYSVSLAYIYLL